ncbi:hypothetical protein Fmac_021775 [Flemingia macrophylla]|uniref:Uncharacterized protein n=1 Tax=Flemingia macrophylla TaxID=520843 RepID=A0ABD1LXT6_9FABA
MGNCLRNNKVSAQDHDHDHDHENYYETPAKVEKIMKVPSAASSKRVEEISMKKKKKMVRLKMENDGACEGGGGDGNCTSVRIRVVMSKEELKRMLRCCKDEAHHTSLEQLLDAVRLRGGRVSEVGEADHKGITSWKPSLDSIPEDI